MDITTKLGKEAVIKKTWKTTPDGGDPKTDAVTVTGEISFEGLTLGQLVDIASKPVVIRRQAVERTLSTIPTTCKVHAEGAGRRPFDPTRDLDKLTEDQQQELLKKLTEKFSK